ncbi:MAG: aspartate-semialdehyde dehydrogenase [Armatimonadota bacterium]|nr:aspartate-semialdehyde dehydrogenase [Armatimonadota bacterium]MDR7449727.1 aspartate-semialdehyde dehydrogenase [Armatimonadota bacterium]MDR7458717.1 aspartate-semialdehyde dehydrogenase [Armatimonadota bacterium]MDR7479326.1 aspartate-semialdehyde dehydrogenase [Armatimonadota bacterium]MDR7487924.1 aspartate-semialdehyde dehydrogenase [Armatimonadota bacterium]
MATSPEPSMPTPEPAGRSGYTVAVVGATGLVGGEMVRLLDARRFPVAALRLFATARSAGRTLPFRGRDVTVAETSEAALAACDLVLFAGGDDASRRFAWSAAAAGAVVVDNSSTWRQDPRVPLVVPEVNGHALARHQGVIANPNCCAAALVMALAPLQRAVGLRRVVVSTYQSASGGGADTLRRLLDETRALLQDPDALVRGDSERIAALAGDRDPLAFNVRPQWRWGPDGMTEEEAKVVAETRKILEVDLPVSVTTVRVPVLVGHTLVVHADLAQPLTAEAARRLFAAAPGVAVEDAPEEDRYPTPLRAAGRDPVLVGRIRRVPGDEPALTFVVASDNLRKGAALNAIQIAEALVARGHLRPRSTPARAPGA